MPTKLYSIPKQPPSRRRSDELAAAIREIAPAAKTIAEELKRRSIIDSCDLVARNASREGPNRGNPA